jgi:hypothetical protein
MGAKVGFLGKLKMKNEALKKLKMKNEALKICKQLTIN